MEFSNIDIKIEIIMVLGSMLYNVAKIMCLINIALYIIFMDKFYNKKKIPLYILFLIIIYATIALIVSQLGFDNIYVLTVVYYAMFIIQTIVLIKTIGATKNNEKEDN